MASGRLTGVLVVDDDPGARQLLIPALGFAGFTVDAAGDLTMSRQGQVLSRPQILEAAWQYDFGGDSVVVERFVTTSRREIGHGRSALLRTACGIGRTLRQHGGR
ncbi:winged helix-turn-helix domain-containing protein [Streptomyces sp. NPDC021224]|uniref:winged helix-turn-helix domain-containing protein n=1 Tax=unclassified Streptomyces TaxID=2593676 RepID=UPI00379A0243